LKATLIEPSLTDLADMYELEAAARQADVLSPISAGILEEVLRSNQLDIINRARLLGFYYRHYWNRRSSFAKQYRMRRVSHILWFIENAPDCRFAGDTYLSVDKKGDHNNYAIVSRAWQASLKKVGQNNQVRINAALFFFRYEPRISMSLLQPILSADPTNAWALAITQLLDPVSQEIAAGKVKDILADVSIADAVHWQGLCDQSFLRHAFNEGARLSPVSVRTLRAVLSVHPSDVTARAELLAFYSHRSNRFNLLGYDPDFEEQFATHLLWFIAHAPGANELSSVDIHDLSAGASELLQAVWRERVKMFGGRDAAIRLNDKQFAKKLRIPTNADRRDRARRLKAWGGRPNSPGVLDHLAIKPEEVLCSVPSPSNSCSLTESANSSQMGHAGLVGGYGWVGPNHIQHLDEVLVADSLDFYNRAKIVSLCCSNNERSKEVKNRPDLHQKHLHWLITNVPDCEFLQNYYWNDLKKDSERYLETRQLWLETVKLHSSNAEVHINAAIAHFPCDRVRARSLVGAALKLEPENLMVLALMRKLDKRPVRISSEQLLKKYDFVAGRKSTVITKASEGLNRTGAWLFGCNLPNRSAWTAEQVLQNNPNELAMRYELMGFHFDSRHCFALSARNPRLSAKHTPHVLWFIRNNPETNEPRHFDSYKDPVGYRAVVAAWKLQLEAYPENAAIAYSASWIFSGDKRFFKEGIDMVKHALKQHPRNQKLKERLKALRRLASYWR
jgi:hypothetical protein